jgi:hypothetical protein
LGALIGGAAGFGIGEMIAGVKSPQREARDDIKSIYGVDIPQNSGAIQAGGADRAVAVRRPDRGGGVIPDLKYAEIDFCLFHVNSGILLQLWKGVIQNFTSDGNADLPGHLL